jgi:hypothetical protein
MHSLPYHNIRLWLILLCQYFDGLTLPHHIQKAVLSLLQACDDLIDASEIFKSSVQLLRNHCNKWGKHEPVHHNKVPYFGSQLPSLTLVFPQLYYLIKAGGNYF